MKKSAQCLLSLFLLLFMLCAVGCQSPPDPQGNQPDPQEGQAPQRVLSPTQLLFVPLDSVGDVHSDALFSEDDSNIHVLSAPSYALYRRFEDTDSLKAHLDAAGVPSAAQTLRDLDDYPTGGEVLLISIGWGNRDYYTLSSTVTEDTLDVVLNYHTYVGSEPVNAILHTGLFVLLIDKSFGEQYSLKVN